MAHKAIQDMDILWFFNEYFIFSYTFWSTIIHYSWVKHTMMDCLRGKNYNIVQIFHNIKLNDGVPWSLL